MAEIRAKLKALDTKNNGNTNTDNSVYPHWNLPDDGTALIRFLPDGDSENTFFWIEKQVIKLPFPGVKGQDETKEILVQVPCMEMWQETCPVLTEIRPWFNDGELEDLARKYWKKRTYLLQGFVQEDGLDKDEPPENPIRRFNISPTIFKIVKAALLDPDMEYNPTDYVNGTDFRINRTKDGTWADYTTSKWARKETALSQSHLEDIKEHGLADLSQYLPKKPTAEGVAIISQMFEASVNGDLYDPELFAEHYKPYGLQFTPSNNGTSGDLPFETPAPAAVTEEKIGEVVSAADAGQTDPAPAADAGQSANDILAILRNRESS